MKVKTISTKFSQKLKLLKTRELRVPLVVISIGVLLSIFIITTINGGLPRIPSPARLFERYKYGELKEIQNYSELNTIFASQPKVSLWNEKKFYLVEACDLNNAACKKFHYENDSKLSTFDRFQSDFIGSGKVTYTWLDYIANNADINNFIYCIVEQKPTVFTDFLKVVSKENSSYDKGKAGDFIKSKGLDEAKFNDCVAKGSYKSRIERLNELTISLGTTSSPTLYLFKETRSTIKNIDGSIEKKKFFTLKLKIEGDKSYDDMRIELLNALK